MLLRRLSHSQKLATFICVGLLCCVVWTWQHLVAVFAGKQRALPAHREIKNGKHQTAVCAAGLLRAPPHTQRSSLLTVDSVQGPYFFLVLDTFEGARSTLTFSLRTLEDKHWWRLRDYAQLTCNTGGVQINDSEIKTHAFVASMPLQGAEQSSLQRKARL